MNKIFGQIGFIICLLAFTAFVTDAQNPVSLSLTVSPNSIAAGGKGSAKISASIDSGWHMYSLTQGAGGPNPTRISIDGGPFKMTGASGPRPKVQMDPNFNINTETYEGGATFNVSFTVAADAPAGAQDLIASVRYQVCNDSTCLPPKTVKVSAPVTVTGAKATTSPSPSPSGKPSPSQSPTPTPSPSPSVSPTISPSPTASATTTPSPTSTITPEPTAESSPTSGAITPNESATPTNFSNGGVGSDTGLLGFIWAALGAGLIALLTPCVFPMIPITVSYFTNHAEGSRAKAVRNALVFALGIIFTFTFLGFLLAVLFGAAGIQNFAASPWVNIFIGGLFVVFALSLFGAYELGMPSSVMTKLDAFARGKESSQYIGLLLMGLVFSLTSFTCTTPFVGTILVASTQGNWLYPIIGMLVFATVFAFPFFVLAIAPQLLAQLPKSGGWLNSVKVVMGFLEIAAAMKFISNVDLVWRIGIFSREVVIASWIAVCLLTTLYLLGFFQLSNDTKPERLGAFRVLLAIIFLSVGFYFVTGLFGKSLVGVEAFLPPKTEVAAINGDLDWNRNENNFEKAVEQAKKENRAIFIDFTGYTCTNCRWMESNIFPIPAVKTELGKFVLARLYTDGEGQPFESFQKMQSDKFGTVALPLYAIVTPDGKTLATFPGLTRDEGEFVKFLKAGQR